MLEVASFFIQSIAKRRDPREARVACMMNEYRTENGIRHVVRVDGLLRDVAEQRAWEMAIGRQPLSHRRHDGSVPYIIGHLHGEIRHEVYFARSPKITGGKFSPLNGVDAINGWIDSPPHNDFLLDPTVRSIGVAFWRSKLREVVVVVGSDCSYIR